MFNLDNSTALVTGATGGIGYAIVKDLVTAGAKVIAVGRNQNKLNQLTEDFKDKINTLECDLKNDLEVSDLFSKAENSFRDIDILVCNAGITKDSLALRLKDEDWSSVIEVNLTTTFKLNRSAIKSMMKRKYGRIINISSVIGLSGNIGQANYAASKGGMIAMSKSLAKEVGTRGITVNCIAPGYIDTPMTQVINEEL